MRNRSTQFCVDLLQITNLGDRQSSSRRQMAAACCSTRFPLRTLAVRGLIARSTINCIAAIHRGSRAAAPAVAQSTTVGAGSSTRAVGQPQAQPHRQQTMVLAAPSGASGVGGEQQAPAAAGAAATAAPSARYAPQGLDQPSPVLLLDIMDTVVYDPFFQDMPRFFDLSFKELLASKHPTAWVQFERGEITEDEMLRIFFSDGRAVDGPALKQFMADCYRYLDGMEPLLQRLAANGVEMHAFSNYPAWWELIEDKLRLSRYLRWTFVSCLPPIKGLRKPSPESFAAVVSHLGVPQDRLLFVDDRQANVDGALAAGIPAIRFESAAALEQELRRRGFQL